MSDRASAAKLFLECRFDRFQHTSALPLLRPNKVPAVQYETTITKSRDVGESLMPAGWARLVIDTLELVPFVLSS